MGNPAEVTIITSWWLGQTTSYDLFLASPYEQLTDYKVEQEN